MRKLLPLKQKLLNVAVTKLSYKLQRELEQLPVSEDLRKRAGSATGAGCG